MLENKPFDLRLIWITPRFPLGAPDGAQHATRSLIYHLTGKNVGIDLLCLVAAPIQGEEDETKAKQDLKVLSCTFIERSRSKFLRLPSWSMPFTFRAFATSKVREVMKQRLSFLLASLASSSGAYIVFDGLHPFAALSELDLQDLSTRCAGVIYRAHNFETAFWEQCAIRSRMPWFRGFFRYQAKLVKAFEARIARSVHLIAPVSEEDAIKFKELAPKTQVTTIPIGMDFPEEKTILPIRDSAELALLFIGRLDWLPNRNGLTWFLEKVWPRLVAQRKGISLQIAGVGNGRWLENYRTLAGVEFLGKVENVQPLYESCALSIAPLFQGSGTRVKIIESSRYARPVLTTALGAEGTGLIPGVSYFRAETEEEWLAALETIGLVDCQKVGWAAFESLRKRFDGKSVAEQLIRALKSDEGI